MKSSCLTLILLMGGLSLAPAALAQEYGMDTQYNENVGNQAPPPPQQQPAPVFQTNGTQAYTTSANAWQDMSYIQGQQAGVQIPGTLQAPLQASPFGTVSSYLGNTGQFIKGTSLPLGTSLPKTQLGLNAVNGGYVQPACGQAGSGGFYGGVFAPPTSKYGYLPPTSTSTVDLNTAY